MPATYYWYERGKHTCGYVWTTKDSHSVVCACTGAWILDGVLTNLDPVTDEVEFKQAVADDNAVPAEEIEIEQGLE